MQGTNILNISGTMFSYLNTWTNYRHPHPIELYEQLSYESGKQDIKGDESCKLFYNYIANSINSTFKKSAGNPHRKKFPRNECLIMNVNTKNH